MYTLYIVYRSIGQVNFDLNYVDSQFPLSPSPNYHELGKRAKEIENQPRLKKI